MNKVLTLSVFLILCIANGMKAQQDTANYHVESRSIIKELNTKKANSGLIKVYHDEFINPEIGKFNERNSSENPAAIQLSNQYVRGYRIQVFSGSNQNLSKREAEQKQNLIKAEFPQHQAILQFENPTWRLRVGNFMNKYEAEATLKEMREKFPSFGKEMYIVQDVIRKPID